MSDIEGWQQLARLDRVLADLRHEVLLAQAKHAPMHSPHEGWAVIREELDPELWEHVCHDTGRSPEARREALQVAAMGVRYVLDLIDGAEAMSEPTTLPEYFMGWDEETVYLRRSDCPTLEAATAEFRRISLDDFGLTDDDIEGIEGVAATVPIHESEDADCLNNRCQCPSVDVWVFAP